MGRFKKECGLVWMIGLFSLAVLMNTPSLYGCLSWSVVCNSFNIPLICNEKIHNPQSLSKRSEITKSYKNVQTPYFILFFGKLPE